MHAVQALEMSIFRTCLIFFEKEIPAAGTRRLTKVQEKSIQAFPSRTRKPKTILPEGFYIGRKSKT